MPARGGPRPLPHPQRRARRPARAHLGDAAADVPPAAAEGDGQIHFSAILNPYPFEPFFRRLGNF